MESPTLFRFKFHAMAAEHELQVFASSAKYSRYRDDSVTTWINRAAGRERVAIDSETAALLRYADQCFRLSEFLFDITSGVLRRVWDFRANPTRIPSPDAPLQLRERPLAGQTSNGMIVGSACREKEWKST